MGSLAGSTCPSSPPAVGSWAGFALWPGSPAGALLLWGVSVSVGLGRLAGLPPKQLVFGAGATPPPGQWLACCVRLWGFAPALAGAGCAAGFRALPAGGVCQVVHRQAGLGASGWVVVVVLRLPAGVVAVWAGCTSALLARRQTSGFRGGGVCSAWGGLHCPTPLARGRAGAFAPPQGILPRKRVLRFGFFPPSPPPAGKANRWAAAYENDGDNRVVKKGIGEPKYYRLLAHPFTLSVLKNQGMILPHLNDYAARVSQSGQEPRLSLPPEMAYHYNVGHYYTSILGTVERIEQVPIFLRRFPNSRFFVQNKITLYRWINYHYTNYLIMSVSLYDIALLLTNETFMLGNAPRHCNESNVAKHKLVRETNVRIALDNLRKAVDDYREPRHLFVHRGHTPPMGFLDMIEMHEFLQEIEEDEFLRETEEESVDAKPEITNLYDLLSSSTIRQDLYRHERRRLVAQMSEKSNELVNILLDLFSSLLPIYESTSKQLSKKVNSRPTCAST